MTTALILISTLCLTAMILVAWMIRSSQGDRTASSTRQDGERAAWLMIQENQNKAYETMMSEQRLTTERAASAQSEMMQTFSGQLSSLMGSQNQLLKRVLVGEDLAPTSQSETLIETPTDAPMSLADELLLLPPHIRDQVIREEAENAFYQQNDSSQDPMPSRIDPRVKVVDPTRTRDEGSVIWSPPSSEMAEG
jgi:hypothetical protein